VECIEFYLAKLNLINKYLWQRPKMNFDNASPIWYDNSKVGVNKVSTFMKILSGIAGLSKVYTNHTPRATCITILGRSFKDTDVATHSGHKSLSAMAIYKRTSEKTKQAMSNVLASTLTTEQPFVQNAEGPTISEKPDQHECQKIHKNCCLSLGLSSLTTDVSGTCQSNVNKDFDQVMKGFCENVDLGLEQMDNAFHNDDIMIQSNVDKEFDQAMSSLASHKKSIPQEYMQKSFVNCSFSGCSFSFN
jgi:hypothetical protein